MKKIPVILVSGFLGSGKTTLLNSLLKHYQKSAVIINEFGTTPIDQQILREHNVPFATLSGGCLCCQVRDALFPLLRNLRLAWEAKLPAPFERLLIETSGVASPETVIDILTKQRWLTARYELKAIITTISAVNGEISLQNFPQAQAQIAWADTIVVTQSDLVDAAQLKSLQQTLRRFAPNTPQIQAVMGAISPHFLISTVTEKQCEFSHLQPADFSAQRFKSICLQLENRLAWQKLATVLQNLLTHYAEKLVRLKGVIYVTDFDTPLIIQGGMGHLYPPVKLASRENDDGIGRLVFITDGDMMEIAETLMAKLRETK